jgi:NAD(P)-dependent dehydrogenase (short-subunit alcohol dehydrogenase family)
VTDPKHILIIAAERGIGLGLAEEFATRGWRVTATRRHPDPADGLEGLRGRLPDLVRTAQVDTTDPASVDAPVAARAGETFDVVYHNAGVWGPMHQSTLEATPDEVAELFMVNAVAPLRIVRRLLDRLPAAGGTIGFSTSLRGSVRQNVEGRMDLYRASKAALNMLTRGLWAEVQSAGHTVLNIHPGWVATDMGTLGGTVQAEIDVPTSVRGVADVIEARRGSNEQVFVDWQNAEIAW